MELKSSKMASKSYLLKSVLCEPVVEEKERLHLSYPKKKPPLTDTVSSSPWIRHHRNPLHKTATGPTPQEEQRTTTEPSTRVEETSSLSSSPTSSPPLRYDTASVETVVTEVIALYGERKYQSVIEKLTPYLVSKKKHHPPKEGMAVPPSGTDSLDLISSIPLWGTKKNASESVGILYYYYTKSLEQTDSSRGVMKAVLLEWEDGMSRFFTDTVARQKDKLHKKEEGQEEERSRRRKAVEDLFFISLEDREKGNYKRSSAANSAKSTGVHLLDQLESERERVLEREDYWIYAQEKHEALFEKGRQQMKALSSLFLSLDKTKKERNHSLHHFRSFLFWDVIGFYRLSASLVEKRGKHLRKTEVLHSLAFQLLYLLHWFSQTLDGRETDTAEKEDFITFTRVEMARQSLLLLQNRFQQLYAPNNRYSNPTDQNDEDLLVVIKRLRQGYDFTENLFKVDPENFPMDVIFLWKRCKEEINHFVLKKYRHRGQALRGFLRATQYNFLSCRLGYDDFLSPTKEIDRTKTHREANDAEGEQRSGIKVEEKGHSIVSPLVRATLSEKAVPVTAPLTDGENKNPTDFHHNNSPLRQDRWSRFHFHSYGATNTIYIHEILSLLIRCLEVVVLNDEMDSYLTEEVNRHVQQHCVVESSPKEAISLLETIQILREFLVRIERDAMDEKDRKIERSVKLYVYSLWVHLESRIYSITRPSHPSKSTGVHFLLSQYRMFFNLVGSYDNGYKEKNSLLGHVGELKEWIERELFKGLSASLEAVNTRQKGSSDHSAAPVLHSFSYFFFTKGLGQALVPQPDKSNIHTLNPVECGNSVLRSMLNAIIFWYRAIQEEEEEKNHNGINGQSSSLYPLLVGDSYFGDNNEEVPKDRFTEFLLSHEIMTVLLSRDTHRGIALYSIIIHYLKHHHYQAALRVTRNLYQTLRNGGNDFYKGYLKLIFATLLLTKCAFDEAERELSEWITNASLSVEAADTKVYYTSFHVGSRVDPNFFPSSLTCSIRRIILPLYTDCVHLTQDTVLFLPTTDDSAIFPSPYRFLLAEAHARYAELHLLRHLHLGREAAELAAPFSLVQRLYQTSLSHYRHCATEYRLRLLRALLALGWSYTLTQQHRAALCFAKEALEMWKEESSEQNSPTAPLMDKTIPFCASPLYIEADFLRATCVRCLK